MVLSYRYIGAVLADEALGTVVIDETVLTPAANRHLHHVLKVNHWYSVLAPAANTHLHHILQVNHWYSVPTPAANTYLHHDLKGQSHQIFRSCFGLFEQV